jgi:hypothetical protein
MKKETLNSISVLIVVLIIFGSVYYSKNKNSIEDVSVTRNFNPSVISTSGDVTCTYPLILNANYTGEVIEHLLPKPETNPMIFTFSNIEEDIAILKFIDASQTISEVPLVKIYEDEDKVTFIDGSGEVYFSMHTIFKKTGVSMYTKQMSVSLLGVSTGSLSVGECI